MSKFYLAESDLEAIDHPVLDQNGEKCALIRVQTTEKGFVFDVGSLGVTRTEDNKIGEVWVYVPAGVNHIDIRHQRLGSLIGYNFPVSIQKGRAYIMQLTSGRVMTIVEDAVTQQYVKFRVKPEHAIVEIDNQLLNTVDGVAIQRLPFGTYDYKVQATNYYAEVGRVTVNDPEKTHEIEIALRPAFSEFTFTCENGAEIWINGQKKGDGTWRGSLPYASYLIECKLIGHRTTSKEVTLTEDMAKSPIALQAPTPIYGKLDVSSTPADADVYIDAKLVGKTPMFIQRQLIGEHDIRISKSGYMDYSATVTIEQGAEARVNGVLEKSNSSSHVAQPSLVKDSGVKRQPAQLKSASFKYLYKGVNFKVSVSKGLATIKSFNRGAKEVVIPSVVEYNGMQVPVVSIDVFYNGDNYSAERVTIEDGVEEISSFCFNEFRNLKRIKVPSSVKRIGAHAIRDGVNRM